MHLNAQLLRILVVVEISTILLTRRLFILFQSSQDDGCTSLNLLLFQSFDATDEKFFQTHGAIGLVELVYLANQKLASLPRTYLLLRPASNAVCNSNQTSIFAHQKTVFSSLISLGKFGNVLQPVVYVR